MSDKISPFHQQLREYIQRAKDAADDDTPGWLMALLRSYDRCRTIAPNDSPGTNPPIEVEIE
ncbi:MAG: hypothetical protein AAGD43_08290 [Pseudomonadota bacterium]